MSDQQPSDTPTPAPGTPSAQEAAPPSGASSTTTAPDPSRASHAHPTDTPLLAVRDLAVEFTSGSQVARAVRGISFDVPHGKTLGLVGESGCGKSVTSLAILRLVPNPPGRIAGGRVLLEGTDLLALEDAAMRGVRGKRISMIFQEPMTSLNPVYTIGNQVTEPLAVHDRVSVRQAQERAMAALAAVGIPNPRLCLSMYPHELSGGMKQRAMIAMALICNPSMLIADEPTTALDVTVQAQILDLLRDLQERQRMSMLFITHDLGVVAEVAHEVCVMYAGAVAERSSTPALFAEPLHPYTIALLRSLPHLHGGRGRLYNIPGMVPSPAAYPPGCKFAARCERCREECRRVEPVLEEKRPGRFVACHDVPKETP